MARTARVVLLLAAAGILAEAQNVRITLIGQSCFVIQTEGGPTVVTDPPVASTGYPLPALTADVRPLEPLVYKPARVMVNRATLPASTQVWVMEAAADVAAVNAASSAAGVPVAPGSLVSFYGAFAGAAARSGLAPGMAGLWQVNAAIPADASPGPDVSIVSNQLSVAVE